jgi:predicted acylesterase/phospholipase RssA
MLERIFGPRRIEDLPHDFYCVTADLGTGELRAHREGPLVDLVGASMSIPGIAPPVAYDGRLLVDGGVLDNLPVDVMAATGEGPIVAVDVVRAVAPDPYVLPPMMETIARALVLGGRQRTDANRALADVLISPDVETLGLLDFALGAQAITAGREAARARMPAVRALWPVGSTT